jgi:predicted MFS family arabinose efflux permease
MDTVYQPELWRDLFVVLGSSSAALIGLLFIATWLHLDEIVSNPVLRRRAYNNTRYLLIVFVEAVLLLLPQPIFMLSAELVAINLFGLWLPLINTYRYFHNNKEDRGYTGFVLSRAIIFSAGFLLGAAGGAMLVERLNWGIYLLTASCIVVLVTVVLNSWSIMLGVGRAEEIKKSNRGKARKPRA